VREEEDGRAVNKQNPKLNETENIENRIGMEGREVAGTSSVTPTWIS
jgi:hypothetical protein